jgi:hypothetical protein
LDRLARLAQIASRAGDGCRPGFPSRQSQIEQAMPVPKVKSSLWTQARRIFGEFLVGDDDRLSQADSLI